MRKLWNYMSEGCLMEMYGFRILCDGDGWKWRSADLIFRHGRKWRFSFHHRRKWNFSFRPFLSSPFSIFCFPYQALPPACGQKSFSLLLYSQPANKKHELRKKMCTGKSTKSPFCHVPNSHFPSISYLLSRSHFLKAQTMTFNQVLCVKQLFVNYSNM